jgi:TolB-like protein/Tfp pilus assembly protein PilF
MSFFNELKRRNVIRVGIAYVIVAWLILQFADVVLNNIEAPDWVFQVIMLVLGIGLPLALFFAWAFELTPEGIKKEKDIDRSESITPVTGQKLNYTIIGLLVLALGYFVWQSQSHQGSADSVQAETPTVAENVPAETLETPSQTVAQDPSIAVLPFVNMSADPEQEYFSDGISEEILNVLVRVDGLKVASRTSSFTYKGENLNIPEIARDLKVGNIVEGSVRKSGNRVRITAQLINTSDDRHLWSDTYDRELTDIFAIQDEIANAIVNALKNELNIGLDAVKVESATDNLDAYDLYLKARGMFIARQDLDVANRLFEQATQLDPGFAVAWEGLAASHWVSTDWIKGDGIDHRQLAASAADKALALDAGLSMPYAVKGMIISETIPHDFLAARKNLDMALANDPKNTTAWLWSGLFYKGLGYADKAIGDFQRCLDIDPGYLNCKQHQAQAYLNNGETEHAMALFTETIEANFHSQDGPFIPMAVSSGQRLLALYMANQWTRDRYAPVIDWIEALENPSADHTARLHRFEQWAKRVGDDINIYVGTLLAFKAYDYFVKPNSMPISETAEIWNPNWAEFRQTNFFKQYARNNNVLAYWHEAGFPKQCRSLGEDDFECD